MLKNILICGFSVLVLAGCGGGGGDPVPPTNPDPPPGVEGLKGSSNTPDDGSARQKIAE